MSDGARPVGTVVTQVIGAADPGAVAESALARLDARAAAPRTDADAQLPELPGHSTTKAALSSSGSASRRARGERASRAGRMLRARMMLSPNVG
jgi:hypothetical protein